LVLLGQNMPQRAALDAGLFDECVEHDVLLYAAERKARELARLPRTGYTKVKRALRREAREKIIEAIAGNEPLYDDWLSEETLAAARAVLHGKG
jgi:enoyl-CoA hydratase/carnithine racemase